MPKQAHVETTYPKDALERLYRNEHDGRLKERLLAILFLYEGNSISHTAQLVKVSRQTVSNWLSSWNKLAYQGLKPSFSGGYPPRLSQKEWDELVESVKDKGYDIEQVRQQLMREKGVEYTYKMVWYKLRKEYKLPYSKPYMENKKMPKDAQKQIEKSRCFPGTLPGGDAGIYRRKLFAKQT
jgi:transposase